MGLQITSRRLLDVLDALEAGGSLLPDLLQKLQEITDVRAAFVEIERIVPALDTPLSLRFGSDAVDMDDAVDVPGEIVAVQLNLQVRQPVGANPLGQRLGQAIVD